MLPVVIQGLTDQSDDVRSVAAISLLPVSDALICSAPKQVCVYVDITRCVIYFSITTILF